MDKTPKIVSISLIIIFIVSSFSLSVSFAAVNSDYNVTGMSPTSPSSPTESPSPTTSPSVSPSSHTPIQPTKTGPHGTIEVSRTEYAALLIGNELNRLKTERRIIQSLMKKYPSGGGLFDSDTQRNFDRNQRWQNKVDELTITITVLEKALNALIPPIP